MFAPCSQGHAMSGQIYLERFIEAVASGKDALFVLSVVSLALLVGPAEGRLDPLARCNDSGW